MSANSQYQVIVPPNALTAKISKIGGPSMAEITANAEVAIRNIEVNYEPAVQANLRIINDAVATTINAPSSAPDALKTIFSMSHDIKGQAATLDYPLLTAIAQSLCRFVSTGESTAAKRLDVIKKHARAMEIVLAHMIKGDGGKKGQELLDALGAAVDKALARG